MVGQGQSGAESLLRFWADAGVDTLYGDAPVDRLVQTPRPRPSASLAPVVATDVRKPDTVGLDEAVNAAREAAAGCESLEALAATIAAFDGCPLKTMGAKQSVFARGNPQGPVMIIGEGPGADEDRVGEPFVGVSGQLLDKMLAAAGLTERVFITNTVFWRPPGNRVPTPQEQAVCRPFVEQAIRLIQPKMLLFVGAAAAKSMLASNEGVTALRGRWFEWSDHEQTLTVPALPTFHPSFLLRQPAQKKKAWSDLLTLAERLDRPARAP